jgi:D-beta-D-heptose 7-phosphate kinase/D-beta-D-heptose 1-phosphate adenosyltransferase
VAATLDAAASAGIPVVVDPKRRSFFDYAGATVLKPNLRELKEALGEDPHPEDSDWMEATRARLGCRHLLVTRGERGMSLQPEGGALVQLSATPHEVYDVSGAGDTVSAAVAVALAVGATPVEAAALANHAAAVEVQRPGARTVAPEEVVAHVRAWQG